MDKDECNRSRFVPQDRGGHYESWFQRANHAERPLAFWIRYTVFSPRGRPDRARAELWAIWFDGERGKITAAKQVFPIEAARCSATGLDVEIGSARLNGRALSGEASAGTHSLRWDLAYEGEAEPILLLQPAFYDRRLPKAKALVGSPNASFTGSLVVDGESVDVRGWVGSQNHNWGSKHTDSYAWSQVAGFDGAPGTFLECSTARLKLGPFWTPPMTVVVLRLEDREIRLNGIAQALCAEGDFDFTCWRFRTEDPTARIEGRFEAPSSAFVGLVYDNPPGGAKTCLNSKLASCELRVALPGEPERTLRSKHRAAFEILTERSDHGIAVVA
ncbi:MAG: hypothetical protein K8R60_09480 [Burkholderiales bacterium]|nr:hypothetical protein [Burkholderiales bacterium]